MKYAVQVGLVLVMKVDPGQFPVTRWRRPGAVLGGGSGNRTKGVGQFKSSLCVRGG